MYKVFVFLIGLHWVGMAAEISDPTFQRILREHQANFSSAVHPKGYDSVSLEGVLYKDNAVIDFITDRKRSNKFREIRSEKHLKVTVGYDGESGWRRKEQAAGTAVQNYTNKGFDWLQFESHFDNHLVRYLKGEDSIQLTLKDAVELDNKPMLVVEALDSEGTLTTYYLNPVTKYLERKELLSADGSYQLKAIYLDYHLVEGIPFAHRIEVFDRGLMVGYRIYSKIHINPSLYDFFFEKPDF